MECRNHCKYRWFLGLGESIGKHKTVDEQTARRLGWIMEGGVTTYIYIYIYIYTSMYICAYVLISLLTYCSHLLLFMFMLCDG